MIIRSVDFAGAVARPGGPPPGRLPQVAFSGRSNVGKSSLINRLLGRTRARVARVSATPGKTREINFFEVRATGRNGRELHFYLVDLPGYGYARVPLALRGRWKPLIESYLTRTRELSGVVQLIDVRHGPTAEDLQMVEFLAATSIPTLFVLTKVDKLRRNERRPRIASVIDRLGVDPEQVIAFSSETGEGRDELLASLEALLGEGDGRAGADPAAVGGA